jgi:hypothetical protein
MEALFPLFSEDGGIERIGQLYGVGKREVMAEIAPGIRMRLMGEVAFSVTSSNLQLPRFRYNTFPPNPVTYRSCQPSLSKSATATPIPQPLRVSAAERVISLNFKFAS